MALLFAAAPLRMAAQQTSPLLGDNPFTNPRGGFQLYSITGFAGWESQFSPQEGYVVPNGQDVGSDTSYGGSAGVGWSRRSDKGSISVGYLASYLGQVHHSHLNALNHFLNINASRRLGRKWNFGFSANASVSTYTQLLYSPIGTSSLISAAGPGDLGGAMLTGHSSNDGLNSQLGSAGTIDSPDRTLFFGNRVFTTSASTSLSYTYSPRLTFNFSLAGSRSQHLNQDLPDGSAPEVFLVPSALEASGNVGVSYAMSPRTQVGFNASGSRGFSDIQGAFGTNTSAFIGHTFGRRWTAQLHVGVGFVSVVHSTSPVNPGLSPVYGGSLGYQTLSNTFMFSTDRSVSQSYGLATADTINYMGAWRWFRPGRTWGTSVSMMRQQYRQAAYGDSSSWRAMAGVTKRMGGHTVVELSYVYGNYKSSTPPNPYQSAQNGVRLSVMWTPQSQERRH